MYLKYVILGIIQGLTEPIPVSSSGHLKVLSHIFNTDIFNDLNFEIIVNFGSLLAILFIYRKELLRLIKNFFAYIFQNERSKQVVNDFRYCMLIIIGSIPVGIAGILLKDFIEAKLTNIHLVGIAFIITSISLLIVRNLKGSKDDNAITYKDAIIIGLMQMVALFPGISRSGMTLVGCLLVGLKRDTALKYTFMLYIPVSVATFALGVFDIVKTSQLSTVLLPYSIGLVLSLVATLISYKWLSNIVKNGKLWYFSIYCLFLALVVLFLF